MKRQEIENCTICGKGLAACGRLDFFKVTKQRFGLDKSAIQQQAGLETFFGGGSAGAVLADVMGPSPDIAKPIEETETSFLICGGCSNDAEVFLSSILYGE